MKRPVGVLLPSRVIRRFLSIGKFVKVGDRYLAAATNFKGESFHITLDGRPAYSERYVFVGPFIGVGVDQYRAVTRDEDCAFHITPDGKPAYKKEMYADVGDFKKDGDEYYATVACGAPSLWAALHGGHSHGPIRITPAGQMRC